ncbi:IS1380 family transposase [Micrococcus terreus]|uniref:IS1380 family transposase n=1 Tax=Micrococcus terreus TaxID=574650 RepID=UPI00254CD3AB|nr:IS1380 family transposase [Micrococcus terreus]MDK7701023.1 IS1380 family transposase [Micrococcus terreus]WOO96782.1 IS1380 family transposase [Micrococcus terreus]
MQVSHTRSALSASFDEPNLIGSAGLVPMMELAAEAGLHQLAKGRLTVPTDKGANAGAKIAALVAGMCAGADSIDDMAILRHGAMKRVFNACYAPSTLGSFLRAFTFGHVRQLDAVASGLLANLSVRASVLGSPGAGQFVYVDVDDTIIEVHGYQKQGSGYGYSGVRGLNALLATASTETAAPVILGQRLRRGAVGSPRGACRLIADALATLKRLPPDSGARMLVRADSAFYGHATVATALKAGADVSVTVRMNLAVKAAIATIADDAWTGIEYPEAIYDETTGTWASKAEVAEVSFTAFTSRKKAEQIPGRLVVRRIPELNLRQDDGQPTLFDTHRFHAFFTTVDPEVLDTVAADKAHRQHAIIEQVNADLKDSALAHLPSGHFWANSAWLACAVMAYNLTRAAGILAAGTFTRARTGTIRARLVNLPARIVSSARRIRIRLPESWPWQQAFERLFTALHRPPQSA